MSHFFSTLFFSVGILFFLIGYLSVGFVFYCSVTTRNVTPKQNDMLFGENVTESRISHATMDSQNRRVAKQLILFLEDGARPNFLYGNESFQEWQPFFQSHLDHDGNRTICTTMQVDPPTSTTQGIKTLLTGGAPSFIELGQTFYSNELSSDHFLKQANRSGLRCYMGYFV